MFLIKKPYFFFCSLSRKKLGDVLTLIKIKIKIKINSNYANI